MEADQIKRLRQTFSYDPETGRIFSLISHRNVGSIDKTKGYEQIFWEGKNRYSHRIAWTLMTGRVPVGVDHVDGCKSNNKWSNLREAAQGENLQNKCAVSKGGHLLGTTFHKRSGKWSARIKRNRKTIYLGNFKTQEEAHQAYLKAKRTVHTFNPVPRGVTS